MQRPLSWYLAAVLLVFGLSVGAPTAWGHTALTSTDPAADSTVPAGPTRVTATFNEPLQPVFAAMTVVGPDGNLWSSGEAEVRDATASVALRPLGPAGAYTVNYRVTSADGHVVAGSWSFTLTAPAAGRPGPPAGTSGPGERTLLWPFALGAAAVIAGAVVLAVRRRRT